MSKKNFKRTAALMLAATMVIGSTMTIFAADDGIAEGTGTYEGIKEEPLPSITVPTDDQMANAYDYVADPNGMIEEAKDNGRLPADAVIDQDTAGILFLYDKDNKKYGKTSKKIEVESQNYKDVDVTVELKLKEGAKGDADIIYADSADFGTGDTASKDKKLYLAITDAAATSPKTAALPASGVVKLTQTISGKPDNFELVYDTTDADSTKHKYVYKPKQTTTDTWEKAAFALTGAINTNAKWGKDATFPTLVVTWSYAEHVDSYLSSRSVSATSDTVTMTLPEGVSVKKVELVDGSTRTPLVLGNTYKITGASLWIKGSVITNNVGKTLDVTYSNDKVDTLDIQ